MPTKKRGKGSRSTVRRSRPAATARRSKRSAPATRKKTAPRARAKGASNAGAKRPAAGAASRELVTLKREKSALEKRLTDTVREIGQLRHHEARAAQLERQLKERDETIAQLRTQLGNLRSRELAPEEDEAQPSLALGSRSVDDLDEFADDEVQDDDDELI
jgi:predicted RNase H-like nuclease (RuvC/YqgF family)